MQNFEKKVSVVVPIYNMRKYIADCIESLINQTFPKEDMQVILVDDGSTDDTADIIKSYTEPHEFEEIQVISSDDENTDDTVNIIKSYTEPYKFLEYHYKENGGLSDARNFGIKNSVGKYIMFLDADDKFSPEVVEKCVSFFEEHYDETDIVTYVHQPFTEESELLPITPRLVKSLTKTGIYSLEESPYIYLTYANIVIKNNGDDTLLFKYLYIEDQLFASTLLLNKKNYGFVKECQYLYRRDNENSITSAFYPTKTFEIFMQSMEELFVKSADWQGNAARYVQALFVGELLWKVAANILLPYHYNESDFKKALSRIDALLDRVDPDIILNFPEEDIFHKHWLLSRKKNLNVYFKKTGENYGVFYGKKTRYTVNDYVFPDAVEVYDYTNKPDIIFKNSQNEYFSISESKKITDFSDYLMVICRITVVHNKLKVYGFVKSLFYNYTDIPADIWVQEIYDSGVKEVKTTSFLSGESEYHCLTHTNNFYGFIAEFDLNYVRGFKFYVKFRDVAACPNGFWFYPKVGIKNRRIIRGEFKIDFVNGNDFYITPCDTFYETEQVTENIYEKDSEIYAVRKFSAELRYTQKNIYIYSDMPHVKKDNAYYLFKNDFRKKDGIQRYYITGLPQSEYNEYFTEEEKKYVVEFYSYGHKHLYLAAKKIFTSFIGDKTHCPFEQSEISDYSDMFDFEIIYLGHGVLHGLGMWQYHAEWGFTDKFVISSDMERKNLIENYNWQSNQIVSTGVPRYNHIDKKIKPAKKILFAPSWRSVFAGQDLKSNNWVLNIERFQNHIWHKSVYKFLTSPKLSALLNQYGYTLDFKPHPIIAGDSALSEIYSKALGKNSPVKIITGDIPIEEYAVFITDYSSFVFDFVYLNRAIMYFFPDYDEWKSGIYTFKEIVVPFDKAFGPFSTDTEISIENLREILKNNAKPEKIYAKRMNNFFLPMSENICDDIYFEIL